MRNRKSTLGFQSCVVALVAPLWLAGCAQSPEVTPAAMNNAYEQTLKQTAPPKSVIFVAGSPAEQAALERLAGYFASMTADSIRQHTAEVYAPDAWLYDNLAIVSGVANIEKYFAASTEQAQSLAVEFLQVVPAGPDYFVRWRMSVVADALNGDQPMVSYGITQFRFDEQGRVLMHRDFWDAATGLYEYVPVLGGLVRTARSRIAEHAN